MTEIRFESGASKYIKKIKNRNLKARFSESFNSIQNNPYIGEKKTGDLLGIYCFDFIYQRTNYEIAYKIIEKDDRFVVIILVGSRELL